MEVKNAVIEHASLKRDELGPQAWVYLDCGGVKRVLYLLPKHHQTTAIAMWTFRIMELAGVSAWEDLRGKTIRTKWDGDELLAIGHLTKDDWYTREEGF